MTEPRNLEPAPNGTQDVTQVAVAEWLLTAAADISQALQDWRYTGTTVLACGDTFSALRITASVVRAATNLREPRAIADQLANALLGGPVVVSRDGDSYYVLVPSRAAQRNLPAGVEYFGRCSLLVVPRPDITDPGRHGQASYWAVPMYDPGTLCQLDAALQLVTVGRHRHLTKGTEQ
ncbi:hypothetical protein ACIQI8_27645 [Streptomyces sp. NPDC092369]|uniref:hypothetical protein n=1 Tax=Streptomyces sp. NPDC092369 TaxID=3366015 RepID=UPI00380E03A1